MQLCKEISFSFKELNEEAVLLSEFYIESRYPGDWPKFSWDDAKKAYNSALKIKEFVLDKIEKF
ncbi:MAG: HEPN domain-containing protein [Candidatus Firestonebacteria bacterium]